MHIILLPLELNHPEDERGTVIYAARLAVEQHMQLLLAYFLNPSYADPAGAVKKRIKTIRKSLKDYRKEIKATMDPQPKVNFRILKSNKADKWINDPQKHKIKMIMICAKNLTDRPFVSLKITSGQLFNIGHTPVLVHPIGREYTPVRKILFGTNFHPFDIEVMKSLSELFDGNKPEIIALHVTRDLNFEKKLKQAGYLKTIKSKVNNDNLKINTLVTRGKINIPSYIHAMAVDRDADLIAVLKEEKHFIGSVLKQGVTNDLAVRSEIPLMVFSVA